MHGVADIAAAFNIDLELWRAMHDELPLLAGGKSATGK